MKAPRLMGVTPLFALPLLLMGCVGPISSENASVMVTSEQSIALSGGGLPLDVEVHLSERHSETAYHFVVLGKEGTGDWLQLSEEEKVGDFFGPVELSFPNAGTWETKFHLLEPESAEPLLEVAGPAIDVFDEGLLDIKPSRAFDTWITGEPMPLAPSIRPASLLEKLSWTVEILRGDTWEEIAAIDSVSPELPAFSDEDEAMQSLRLVAYLGGVKFAEGVPFEIRVASPGTLIREAWNRENNVITPEKLWDEISSATYPGVQFPTDADRADVIREYERYGMPRTSVLIETLVKVPDIDLEYEYNGRPCSDPEVLSKGFDGTHFLYDIEWYRDRIAWYSTFLEGRMYQHRSLCYD